MDKEQYTSEADRQLGDARFYRRLDSDPTQEFKAKVVTKLKEMLHSGETSEKTSTISQSPTPERADSIFYQKYTNLATLDVQLSQQIATQLNGFRSLSITISDLT
ncbi:hypothetical protein DPMN_089111 [Dreissena polymorpha]|uniref:Uncharacterized protein n=1 Tax=Dreissena polymorpha TaxID=45954 RepID=A0A9D4KW57_DREPO|nr:hypothetical protein DPMN_089111 [Dreissena polymorpha]